MNNLNLLGRPALFLAALFACIAPFGAASSSARAADVAQYVNPFVGTAAAPYAKGAGNDQEGDTFPGAAYPMGMFSWSPDTPGNRPGGYLYSDNQILGFSLTHFSGRGCNVYQNFPFLPVAGPLADSPGANWKSYVSTFSHANETAVPGYYRVKEDNGVQTELTVTKRTGVARFTFPSVPTSTLLIGKNDSITVVGNKEISGSETAKVGCGRETYTVYFDAQFARPFASSGTYVGATVTPGAATVSGGGVYVTFNTAQDPAVLVHVGLSFVSADGAKANLRAESGEQSFDAIRSASNDAWNSALSSIVVTGGSLEGIRTFYSALYHCFFHPNVFDDADGHYVGFDGNLHQCPPGHDHYENITAWDAYRSETVLLAIIRSREMNDIAQSLVDDAHQDAVARPINGGGFPRWEQANRNSGGMTGDGDDVMIADAYAFGAREFDTSGALDIMRRAGSVADVKSDGHNERGGMADYLKLGYLAKTDDGASASVTLEYDSDDFAISRFAHDLGKNDDAAHFLKQAQNWRNLLNPDTKKMTTRTVDGTWGDARSGFTEGTSEQYTWLVPFNYAGLIKALGGNDVVGPRLDEFFTELNGGFGSSHAYMGNEPCEETPFVYDWVGTPSKSQNTVRRIQTQLFNPTEDGLPGNDDAGAISSWYVLSCLGLYPDIPGLAGFVVGSPYFTKVTVNLENNHAIVISGLNAEPASPYVQSLAVNGRPCNKLWIPWETLANGGMVTFTLGRTPSTWATSPNAVPPSFDVAQ
jgi:predicted alpha-1,2-mannosidase